MAGTANEELEAEEAELMDRLDELEEAKMYEKAQS